MIFWKVKNRTYTKLMVGLGITILVLFNFKNFTAIAHKIVDVGFKVIPKRWILECTFGWLNHKTSYEHIVYINVIMLKRLAEPSKLSRRILR